MPNMPVQMYSPRICDAVEARGSSKSKDKEDKVDEVVGILYQIW